MAFLWALSTKATKRWVFEFGWQEHQHAIQLWLDSFRMARGELHLTFLS